MTHKVLEVLIPTYGRPYAAINAIDSVLTCKDPRIGVFCHSNGIENELESAILERTNIRYGFFSQNMGMIANFRKVLIESQADYVLFLSDEDRIDPQHISAFADYLATVKPVAALCSILENTGRNYFSLEALKNETLSVSDLMLIFPIDPTYLSGYCFHRKILTEKIINEAFQEHEANVYPHVLLRNKIAQLGKIGIFHPPLIRKGIEANTGGDSHSHIEKNIEFTNSTKTRAILPLNPKTYGERARALQFYYLISHLSRDINLLKKWQQLYIKIYTLNAWLHLTCEAHKYVTPDSRIATLQATISENRSSQSRNQFTIETYNWILSIQNTLIRSAIVSLMWNSTKLLKFILFAKRFGFVKTLNFFWTRRY